MLPKTLTAGHTAYLQIISTNLNRHPWCKWLQACAPNRLDRRQNTKGESTSNGADANRGAPVRSTVAGSVPVSTVVIVVAAAGLTLSGSLEGTKRLSRGWIDGEDHARFAVGASCAEEPDRLGVCHGIIICRRGGGTIGGHTTRW